MGGSLVVLSLATVLCLVPMVTSQIDSVTFRINEELEAGTFVGNIAAETDLGTNNGYSFKIIDKYAEDFVMLNLSSGELKTAKVIDREELCPYEKTCVKEFQVTAFKDSILQTIMIQLDILDINDNTPSFEPDFKITLNLSESNPVNTETPLPAANDPDTGVDNGVTEYIFSPFYPAVEDFELIKTNDPPGLSLRLIRELDHEKKESYQLLILAKDAGIPVRTGTLTVSINVLDENDNKPVFVDSVLNITVTEDISVGNVIVVLRANDDDSGKNGDVTYQLAPRQAASIYESFDIDPKTGELSVAKKLDYEPGNAMKTIYIVASDKGTAPLSAQAVVYLTILDAGNNPPQITLTYLVPEVDTNVILVSENASLDEAVVHVNVEDSDTGSNGNVSCRTHSTYFGLKEVSSSASRKGFKVFVQHLLNREFADKHNVTVSCVDGGDLSTTVVFVVNVKDENDNSPRFSMYIYNAEMKENNTYGAQILTVFASDEDIGENGRVSFYIHPDDVVDFEIEENTGIIRAKTKLDREKNAEKVFKVLAVDNGKPRRTSTATVILDIIDINDMRPEFTKSMYEFEVREGLPSGTQVDFVTAKDLDQGENKRLEYFLLPNYKTGGKFEVPFEVIQDGKILTNTELDREQKSMYNFEVGVIDAGVPPLNNTVRVVVKVGDVNDHSPVFVFPTQSNDSITALNEVSKEAITQVRARDDDAGVNQELMYYIIEGNNEGIFAMNSTTGEVFIESYVHLTQDKTYTLKLSVFDKGQPPLNAKSDLKVHLRYSNATMAHVSGDDNNKSYVIIVITVVCITCLLSVTIITVICLIRRKDLHKCSNKNDNMKLSNGASKMGHKGGPLQLGSDGIYPDTLQPKNKKEVSFSLDEGDSFSSSDFKMLSKDKNMFPSKQTSLHKMPEEVESPSGTPHGTILRDSNQYVQLQGTKFMDQPDVQLNVSHQREDSHSETSGETTTSHDSGKGGSVVEGDHSDPRIELNQLNPSAYLINQSYRSRAPHPAKPSPSKSHTQPLGTLPNIHKPKVHYNDNYTMPSGSQHRTRNWCQNQHSDPANSSYPDSDYLSVQGSVKNYSHGHVNAFPDTKMFWGSHNNSNMSHSGFMNHGYDNLYPTFRTNSTRDDDETTTTSGSYTINAEDLDDDLKMVQNRMPTCMNV